MCSPPMDVVQMTNFKSSNSAEMPRNLQGQVVKGSPLLSIDGWMWVERGKTLHVALKGTRLWQVFKPTFVSDCLNFFSACKSLSQFIGFLTFTDFLFYFLKKRYFKGCVQIGFLKSDSHDFGWSWLFLSIKKLSWIILFLWITQ